MRWALGLSYLGQRYDGWQSQPGGRTVQDQLEAALDEIIRPFRNRNLNDLPPFDVINPTAERVAEYIGEAGLAGNPIAHPQHGEIRTPGFARGGVDRARASGAVAAANIIERHHKKFVGIYRFTGANIGVPPAGALVVHAVITGGVVMAGERVANQHRIGFGRV